MTWADCWNHECKLGWGWNEDLNLLIPVEGEPLNVTSETENKWEYFHIPVSSTNIQCWVSFLLAHQVHSPYLGIDKSSSGTGL